MHNIQLKTSDRSVTKRGIYEIKTQQLIEEEKKKRVRQLIDNCSYYENQFHKSETNFTITKIIRWEN